MISHAAATETGSLRVCPATLLCFQELRALPELRANPFAKRLCELFSEDGSGQLTFVRFVSMMGIFSNRTSLESKIIWAFAIWDFDGEEALNGHARVRNRSWHLCCSLPGLIK